MQAVEHSLVRIRRIEVSIYRNRYRYRRYVYIIIVQYRIIKKSSFTSIYRDICF